MFTKLGAAKYVVNYGVQLVTARAVARVITDFTDHTDDEILVILGSGAAGWYVANCFEPLTDALVETTAARLSQWKQNRVPEVVEAV